jgi:hypothetical protein
VVHSTAPFTVHSTGGSLPLDKSNSFVLIPDGYDRVLQFPTLGGCYIKLSPVSNADLFWTERLPATELSGELPFDQVSLLVMSILHLDPCVSPVDVYDSGNGRTEKTKALAENMIKVALQRDKLSHVLYVIVEDSEGLFGHIQMSEYDLYKEKKNGKFSSCSLNVLSSSMCGNSTQ